MSLERTVSPSSFEEEEHSIGGDSSKRSVVDEEVSPVDNTTAVTVTGGVATTATAESGETAAPGAEEACIPKPKRPLSAYNMFFRDQREHLLQQLPARQAEYSGKGHNKIGFQDLARVIGAKWREIDPQEKERYEQIAAKGREKYLEHTKLWKQQQKAKGLPTTRRKKKDKRTKGPANTGAAMKRSSFSQVNQSLAFGHIPSIMNGTSLSTAARGAITLPPHGGNMQASMQEIPTSMGPRVVSGIPHEIGVCNTNTSQSYMNGDQSYAGPNQVFQNFASQEIPSGMLQQPSSMNFDQGFNNYTAPSATLPEYAPVPFQTESFSAEPHFDPRMSSNSTTFPAFHPLEGGCRQEASMNPQMDPLPFSTQLPYDSLDDVVMSQEMQLQPQQVYSNNTRQQPSLHNLANTMGQDCINTFVGMFGSSCQGQ